jgi:2-C-methyl-D-erythritol 4-phosphate cytidylyltransferase
MAAPTVAAILVAAGASRRMAVGDARLPGPALHKPLLQLAGRTLLEHALAALQAAETVREIVLVGHPDDLQTLGELLRQGSVGQRVIALVPGGAERADSVRAGVAAAGSSAQVLAVHDAARPLVRPERVDAVCRAAAVSGAALLAVPARDTLKWSDDGRRSSRTLERSRIHAAHTPQAFDAQRFREVLARAAADGFRATDDAALWEHYVGPVELVDDDPTNFKVTTPPDLELAAALLALRAAAGARA